jgi:hypothetical protein
VLHAFQPTATRKQRAPKSERRHHDDVTHARRFWCAACNTPVTSEDECIDIGGGQRHRFVNPAGVEYEIGCFAHAVGCIVDGAATTEHSWFAGYAWSFAFCANCRAHLGWCYQGDDGRFFGLILARLVGPV